MKHACESCGQKYAIPNQNVMGRMVKVRCKKCQGIMNVDGTHVTEETPEAQATEAPMHAEEAAARWYVAVAGKPQGPYSAEQILMLVDLGEIRVRTLLWRKGMESWQRVVESEVLRWVKEAVDSRESRVDPNAFRTPTGVFEPVPAALVTDGRSYFPDPTLHTGFTILSDEAQAYLAAVAQRDAEHRRAMEWKHTVFLAAVVALGLLNAVGAWAMR